MQLLCRSRRDWYVNVLVLNKVTHIFQPCSRFLLARSPTKKVFGLRNPLRSVSSAPFLSFGASSRRIRGSPSLLRRKNSAKMLLDVDVCASSRSKDRLSPLLGCLDIFTLYWDFIAFSVLSRLFRALLLNYTSFLPQT